MKKLTPSPKYTKSTERTMANRNPPSLHLNKGECQEFIKQHDKDFREGGSQETTRDERQVQRLFEKEDREERWGKRATDKKWKVKLFYKHGK